MGATAQGIRAGRAFVELLADDSKLQAVLKRSQIGLLSFSDFVRTVGLRMFSLGSVLSLPFVKATSDFAKFDDQMREVAGVVSATENELAMLTRTARRLAQERGTSFLATDIGALMAELGRSGFVAGEVDRMTRSVLLLARATKTEVPIAAKITGSTLRQFGLAVDQTGHVTDLLAKTANASATSVESLGASLEYAGKPAADLGYSLKQTLAMIGVLGNLGIIGTEAGTAIRRLGALTSSQAAEMQRIFKVAFKDARGNALPLIDVLERISQTTAQLGSADRMKMYHDAFGILGITSAIALGGSAKSARELVKELDNVAGYSERAAKRMDGGLGGSLRQLWASLFEDELSVGYALEKHLIPIVDRLTLSFQNLAVWIQQNPITVEKITKGVVGIVAAGSALISLGIAGGVAALNLRGIGYALHAALTPARLLSDTLGGVLSLTYRAEKLGSSWAGLLMTSATGGGKRRATKPGGRSRQSNAFAEPMANLLAAVFPSKFLPTKTNSPTFRTQLARAAGFGAIRRNKAKPKGSPSIVRDFVGLDTEQTARAFMARSRRLGQLVGFMGRSLGRGMADAHLGLLGAVRQQIGILGHRKIPSLGFSKMKFSGISGAFPHQKTKSGPLASLWPAMGFFGGITTPIQKATASIYAFAKSTATSIPLVNQLAGSVYQFSVPVQHAMSKTRQFAGGLTQLVAANPLVKSTYRLGLGGVNAVAKKTARTAGSVFRFSPRRARGGFLASAMQSGMSFSRSGFALAGGGLTKSLSAIGLTAGTTQKLTSAGLSVVTKSVHALRQSFPGLTHGTRLISRGFIGAHQTAKTLAGMLIEKLVPVLKGTVSGLGSVGKAAMRAFGPVMSLMGALGSGVVGGLAGGIGLLLNPMTLLVGAGIAVVANWDRIKGAITGVVRTAPGALSGMWGRIKSDAMPTLLGIRETAFKAFGGIQEAISAGDIPGAMRILWAGIRGVWGEGFGYLRLKWFDLTTWAGDAFSGVLQIATTSAAAISNWFDARLFDWFGVRLNEVTGFFSEAWGWIGRTSSAAADWVSTQWNAVFGSMGEAGQSLSDIIWNSFEWMRKKIAQTILLMMRGAQMIANLDPSGMTAKLIGASGFNLKDAQAALDDQFDDRARARQKVASGDDPAMQKRLADAKQKVEELEKQRAANALAARADRAQIEEDLRKKLELEQQNLAAVIDETKKKRELREANEAAANVAREQAAPVATKSNGPTMPKGLTAQQQRSWSIKERNRQRQEALASKKLSADQKKAEELAARQEKKKRLADDQQRRQAGGLIPDRKLFLQEGPSFFDQAEEEDQQKTVQRAWEMKKSQKERLPDFAALQFPGARPESKGIGTGQSIKVDNLQVEKNTARTNDYMATLIDEVKKLKGNFVA